jgi:electron transport complex protein RnfA
MDYLLLAIAAIFVNNILLAKFLGNCPFLGVSKRMTTAVGMAFAVIFVLTLAAAVAWFVHHQVLMHDWNGDGKPGDLVYIRTLAFILVIAALVQLTELFLRKASPALYRALGIFLPLITTNCAVFGVAIMNITNAEKAAAEGESYGFLHCLVFSFASAVGFGLALVLFAGMRERFETVRIPKALRGTGIGLVTAGFMSLAFFAFKGML